MSEVKVNKVTPRSGTTLTIGDSGDTTNVVGTLQNNGAELTGDISSVVAGTGLAGGGTTGDVTLNIEAAQPTITSTGTLTSFRSTGIDDNADALAMTIDSSENIQIAKTARADDTVGHSLQADGLAVHTRDGNEAMFLNRKSSDGKILSLRKDNTEVGAIGIQSGGLTVDGETNHSGIRFSASSFLPRKNNADVDGTVDLGTTDGRWKDIYLSGGAFLGGTGTANKLDDYEEGTFTPAFSFASGSIVHSAQNGVYTKVGRMVNFSAYLHTSGLNSPSGNAEITGLPFAVQGEFGGNVGIMYRWATANLVATLTPRVSGSGIQLFIGNSNVEAAHLQGSDFNGGSVKNVLLISGTYPTT